MRRREFIAGVGCAILAAPLPVRAQTARKPVIGLLGSNSQGGVAAQMAGMRLGLGEAGYVEGQNLAIEYRWADGVYDRLQALAADLLGSKVDVIVAQGPPAAHAAKRATTTIPIVFGVGIDPVGEGLVASLARPGGNVTGFTLLSADLTAKRLGLLSELAPGARRFALLVNPNNSNPWIGTAQDLARDKGLQLLIMNATSESETEAAFETMVQEQVQALAIGEDSFLNSLNPRLAALADRHRIPTISLFRGFTDAGGLICYGPSLANAYRQIGVTAGKILKGAKPADLPVQNPTKFEMVLNLKTAKALGLDVPTALLAQADEVIE